MQTMMISMNIASNGRVMAPEALVELRRQVRDLRCSAETELAYHRQLWRLSGFDTYQYTLSTRSPRKGASDIRVRVVGGVVTSAHRLDDPGARVGASQVGTVEQYFQWIEQALERRSGGARIHYHPLYGYPLSFSLEETLVGQTERRQLA